MGSLLALIRVNGGIKLGQRRKHEAFTVILHQSVFCPCIISDVLKGQWVANEIQVSGNVLDQNQGCTPQRHCPVAVQFYGILSPAAIRGEFLFQHSPQGRRFKQCLPPEELRETTFRRIFVDLVCWISPNGGEKTQILYFFGKKKLSCRIIRQVCFEPSASEQVPVREITTSNLNDGV